MVTRRQVLSSAIASTISSAGLGVDCAQAAEDSLSATFSRNNLYFGSAVRIEAVVGNQDFRDLLLRECDYFTPEVALKWAAVERSPRSVHFTSMDPFANFPLANKKRLCRHTLVLDKNRPPWAPHF